MLPGATLELSNKRPARFALPLWVYWSEIARQHAEISRLHHPSDEIVDAISAAFTGEDRERPQEEVEKDVRHEPFSALVAITAAAFALDAFYGTVKPMVSPPKSDAARERQILECLKLGFKIGKHAPRWQEELDWLFTTRDNAVHHSEELQETVVVRMTAETVVVGGSETFNFSADSAERAARVVAEIIQTCLENPKAPLRDWAKLRRQALEKMAGVSSS